MQSLGEALVVVVAFFLPARADCSSALRGEVKVDGDEHVELEQDLAVQRRWLGNVLECLHGNRTHKFEGRDKVETDLGRGRLTGETAIY